MENQISLLKELPSVQGDILTEYISIAESGLFDVDFYVRNNSEIIESRENPLVHYLTVGSLRREEPNELFDTEYYLSKLAEDNIYISKDINPLVHFIEYGSKHGYQQSSRYRSLDQDLDHRRHIKDGARRDISSFRTSPEEKSKKK